MSRFLFTRRGETLDRRSTPALLFVALALAALVVPLPEEPAAPPAESALACVGEEPLFLAMSIADETGAMLAEPKLLGLCGVPLSMQLTDPGELEPRMRLSLQPEAGLHGDYEIAFRLSVPGKVKDGRGTLRVRPGEGRTAKLDYPGGHLDVQLVAFSVPSQELELYLEQGAALLAPSRT